MKNHANCLAASLIIIGMIAGSLFAASSENFKVFLCFGQSNMAGGQGVSPGSEETKTTNRVMAFAFNNCSNPSWQKDSWVSAREPLHCGDGGSGNSTMGPAYVFGKAIADSFPDDTIGLIPCAQSGVNIEYFMKNGSFSAGYRVPYPGGTNVYSWMMNRCKKAIERGVLAGIILHQGESNSGQNDWPNKVKTIYEDLKKDLNLTHDIPLVAGELLRSGCCGGHNSIVAKIPSTLPFGYVASSEGLSGVDQYHFNAAGQRELGKRFAIEMIKGLRAVAQTGIKPRQRVVTDKAVALQQNNIRIFSLDGKVISTEVNILTARNSMKPGNIYIVSNRNTGASAKLMVIPDGR